MINSNNINEMSICEKFRKPFVKHWAFFITYNLEGKFCKHLNWNNQNVVLE